jgi:hypothetical protein
MTKIQESNLLMELAVEDLFTKNGTITALLPNFGNLHPQYTANIEQIQIIKEQQGIDKSGISDAKDELRADVIDKALDVSRKTEVYASMNNNAILAKEVHYSESDLKRSTDSNLKDNALIIHDKANENIAALGEYGVNTRVLSSLKSAIDQFNVAIPSTRIGKTETKQVTGQLAKLFKDNDALLAKFDLLVEIVRLSQPAFYSAYKDSRKVIPRGTGSLALKATVTDAATREGIKGVKVSFALQNGLSKAATATAKKPFVKTTADKGIFKIKNLADGTYIATLVKTGYLEQVVTINVANGEMTVMDVKMEKG